VKESYKNCYGLCMKTMSKIHPPSSKKEKDGMPYYIRRWKLVNQRCLAMIRKTCYVIDEFDDGSVHMADFLRPITKSTMGDEVCLCLLPWQHFLFSLQDMQFFIFQTHQ
jgi:hypothetical protein